jgi:YfiH family protein
MFQNDYARNIRPLFRESLPKLVHGSLTRHGGNSTAPFSSNNISFGVGDDPERVKRNRAEMKKRLGLDFLISAHQTHGDNVYHVLAPIKGDYKVEGYDALITNQPRAGLLIQHADCQPVMVYDKVNRVIAAIHSGWRGSVVNIIEKTIEEMKLRYGSDPENLVAAVGPSLGPCCSEFVNYKDELPESFLEFQIKKNYFDFWGITRYQLMQCGIKNDSVTIVGECTSCSPDYFSYRRACRNGDGVTGRNGSLIALI